MHEASLVSALLNQVNELAAQYQGSSVTEIRVEVGLLAGVEPILFSEAFQRLRTDAQLGQAELILDAVGLTCRCTTCQLEYVSAVLIFVCPDCGSVQIDVTSGDSIVLHSITLAHSTEATTTP
jgi:hydrogenase nickel incorporation protein HypA/HybF